MKMGLYARISAHDQQILILQREAMTAYVNQRGGSIELLIDAIVVWRLDRWGRSLD